MQYWKIVRRGGGGGQICKINEFIKGENIINFIKAHRIKWIDHTQRVDNLRQTEILFDCVIYGSRPHGRPRNRWRDDAGDDLRTLGAEKMDRTDCQQRCMA